MFSRLIIESAASRSVCRAAGGEPCLAVPAFIQLMRITLAEGIPFQFRARGSSMHPFIKDGDEITVSPVRNGLPGVGDVVAFIGKGSERLLVHRIIHIDGDSYGMKGDGTIGGGDNPVTAADILGIVSKVRRDGKKIRGGIGTEKWLIAWCSRRALLTPAVHVASRILHVVRSVAPVAHQKRATLNKRCPRGTGRE